MDEVGRPTEGRAPLLGRVGTVLRGTYRIDAVLGRGAAGAVYQATHLPDGQLVALKLVRQEDPAGASLYGPGAEDEVTADAGLASRRFAREARIGAALQHPNIVRVLETFPGSAEDPPFLVMELLRGETLAEALRRRPLTPAEALRLYEPLCAAIAYAHEQGVVHRDLKPDNIFLVEGDLGTPRVLDFGIGKVLSPGASHLTGDTILGTPAYMAPELVRAPALADGQADVFALGAVLFHALTGHKPFDGDNLMAVLGQVLTETPSVRRHLPTVSRRLEEVLLRAMDREPPGRPPGALALLAELREAVRALERRPRLVPAGESLADSDVMAPTDVGPRPAPPGSSTEDVTAPVRTASESQLSRSAAAELATAEAQVVVEAGPGSPGPVPPALEARWPRRWGLALALGSALGVTFGALSVLWTR